MKRLKRIWRSLIPKNCPKCGLQQDVNTDGEYHCFWCEKGFKTIYGDGYKKAIGR
jgi:hypothetical protein